MHQAVLEFVAARRPDTVGAVLDVGGRDINGSPRQILADATSWLSVDLIDGPGVDIVGDIVALDMVDVADTVVCLEVLEHAENWPDIVAACVTACRPGGRVLLTAAGPSRVPHSAFDGGPLHPGEHYENITVRALTKALKTAGAVGLTVVEVGDDIQAWVDIR